MPQFLSPSASSSILMNDCISVHALQRFVDLPLPFHCLLHMPRFQETFHLVHVDVPIDPAPFAFGGCLLLQKERQTFLA